MSITAAANIYQKMLEKPENRKSTSGQIRQPTPYDGSATGPTNEQLGHAVNSGEDLNPEESAYLADIDKRMAARQAGAPLGPNEIQHDVSRIEKLEKEVSELQELMTEMMKTHIKLLGKIK